MTGTGTVGLEYYNIIQCPSDTIFLYNLQITTCFDSYQVIIRYICFFYINSLLSASLTLYYNMEEHNMELKYKINCRTLGSHSSGYEKLYLLGSNNM
jgi:hypothetical protein